MDGNHFAAGADANPRRSAIAASPPAGNAPLAYGGPRPPRWSGARARA
ncbi:hypothetical protein OG226_28145 [Streptomyces sp. NBC_01261]|nr:hypothetical protein [Streptomyces sp. NBC_01261]